MIAAYTAGLAAAAQGKPRRARLLPAAGGAGLVVFGLALLARALG